MWDRESGECLAILKGHNGGINSVAISNDTKFIVSGSNDCTIRVWETESSKEVQKIQQENAVSSVAISSQQMIASAVGSQVRIFLMNGSEVSCI